jgi:hypothetical protein
MQNQTITEMQYQNIRILKNLQLQELRAIKKKLEEVNAKLDPIEKTLPDHLKRIIEHHNHLIQLSKLKEPARRNYLLYMKAMQVRKGLEDKIISLTKELEK